MEDGYCMPTIMRALYANVYVPHARVSKTQCLKIQDYAQHTHQHQHTLQCTPMPVNMAVNVLTMAGDACGACTLSTTPPEGGPSSAAHVWAAGDDKPAAIPVGHRVNVVLNVHVSKCVL